MSYDLQPPDIIFSPSAKIASKVRNASPPPLFFYNTKKWRPTARSPFLQLPTAACSFVAKKNAHLLKHDDKQIAYGASSMLERETWHGQRNRPGFFFFFVLFYCCRSHRLFITVRTEIRRYRISERLIHVGLFVHDFFFLFFLRLNNLLM